MDVASLPMLALFCKVMAPLAVLLLPPTACKAPPEPMPVLFRLNGVPVLTPLRSTAAPLALALLTVTVAVPRAAELLTLSAPALTAIGAE